MQPATVTEAKQLLVRIRASFVLQGTTLTAWCKDNKVHPQAVRQALYGAWAGPKATALVKRVIKASGVRAAA